MGAIIGLLEGCLGYPRRRLDVQHAVDVEGHAPRLAENLDLIGARQRGKDMREARSIAKEKVLMSGG